MPTINKYEKQVFACELVRTESRTAAYRKIRPRVKSEDAADKGARRLLADAEVAEYIEQAKQQIESQISNIAGHLSVADAEQVRLARTIALTEIELINEYIAVAMMDPSAYYDNRGHAKSFADLLPEQRRQIRRIKWAAAPGGARVPEDYELYDAMSAREQLAKIMGIANPSFDFAGLVALLTGRTRAEAADEIKRLDHAQGVQFAQIRERAKSIIEGEAETVDA